MPFSFPENCPTLTIMSRHGEQQARGEIHPRTAHRGGGEFSQYRRCAALLRDSPGRRHSRPYQPQDQAARHRYVALRKEGGPERRKAEPMEAHSRAGSCCPGSRLTAAEASPAAPGTVREWRTLHLRGVWHRGQVEQQADSITRG